MRDNNRPPPRAYAGRPLSPAGSLVLRTSSSSTEYPTHSANNQTSIETERLLPHILFGKSELLGKHALPVSAFWISCLCQQSRFVNELKRSEIGNPRTHSQ